MFKKHCSVKIIRLLLLDDLPHHEKEMAEVTVIKNLTRLSVMTSLRGSQDEVDRLYKLLMCQKLIIERKRDFFPTDAERNAYLNNYKYIVKQVIDVMAAITTEKTRMTPDATSVTLKEISDALVAHQEGLSLHAESEERNQKTH